MKNICIIIYKKNFNKIYIPAVSVPYFSKNYHTVVSYQYRYPYPKTYPCFFEFSPSSSMEKPPTSNIKWSFGGQEFCFPIKEKITSLEILSIGLY